jgi:hypothetical protein
MAGGNTQVLSGSEITAGESAAAVHLRRGGEVRVCPHSSVSLTASQDGRSLMLAVGGGAIETAYTLTSTADTILTPDFRVLLPGPGDFHFAIASDNRGNTCIRALASDTASVIVNETMGDGVYQVPPGGQVLFRNGTVKDASGEVPLDCGCSSPPPSLRAAGELSAAIQQVTEAILPPPAASAHEPITAPLPPTAPNDVHISVDAPFVFRATKPEAPALPQVTRLRLQSVPAVLFYVPATPPGQVAQKPPRPVAQKPPSAQPAPKKTMLGRVRSFLGTLFH